MSKIDTVNARKALAPRREPYWHRASKGRFVGFRLMTKGGTGNWLARAWDEVKGRDDFKPLGDFTDLPDHKRFDAAMADAGKWFEHIGKGGSTGLSTVRTACERYVAHQQATKPAAPMTAYAIARRKTADVCIVPAAEDARKRFERYVLNDNSFADTDLGKLTPGMLDAWRKDLAQRPTKGGGNRGEKRTDASLNRDMSCLRAALNLAFDDGLVTSDFAWRGKLRPIKNADRRRELYLDKGQRRRLISAAPPDLSLFLKGMALLPLRPGALAALPVGNFDQRLSTLLVGTDKAGKDRKLKLPADTAQFFAELAADKLPAAPLFARADGRAWDKDAWKGPMRAAVTAAKAPEGTTAYTLRHSTITDLVHGGLDLLTVAQISGTSVSMIERHYGHLRGNVAADALARLAL